MLGLIFVSVNLFLVNVVMHEEAHYLAAVFYELEPEISFEFQNITGAGFGFDGVPLASTRFSESESVEEMIVVVGMGPFINLFLGAVFFFFFVFMKGDGFIRDCFFLGFLVSLGSVLMNLLPLGGSDGVFLVELLGKT